MGDHRSGTRSQSGAAGGSHTGEPAELTEQWWLNKWAFAISPYGLNLTSDDFWSLTPREEEALFRQWEHPYHHANTIYAELRACLENGLFVRPTPVTAAQFMPGYISDPVEPQDTARLLRTVARFQKPMTAEEKQAAMVSGQIFKERQAVLKAARERGADRDELRRIMERGA